MQAHDHYVREDDAEPLGKPCGTYRLGAHGLDSISLKLAAGPSEPLRPLSMVASGGESSRIMLALKAAPVHVLKATCDEPASDLLLPASGGRLTRRFTP